MVRGDELYPIPWLLQCLIGTSYLVITYNCFIEYKKKSDMFECNIGSDQYL